MFLCSHQNCCGLSHQCCRKEGTEEGTQFQSKSTHPPFFSNPNTSTVFVLGAFWWQQAPSLVSAFQKNGSELWGGPHPLICPQTLWIRNRCNQRDQCPSCLLTKGRNRERQRDGEVPCPEASELDTVVDTWGLARRLGLSLRPVSCHLSSTLHQHPDAQALGQGLLWIALGF